MAYSGLGSGIISDPYQIATESQFIELQVPTYSASDYFVFTSDICTNLIGFWTYSNIDGSSHRLTISGNRTNPNLPLVSFQRSYTYFKNIEVYFNDLINGYPLQHNSITNFTLNNVRFIFNPFYQATNDNTTMVCVFNGDCPSTWNISNVYFEGPILKIFNNVSCSLDNIAVVATKPIVTSNGFLLQNFNGINTHIKNCYIKIPSIYLTQAGLVAYNISGTNNMIEQCYFEGEIQGNEAGVFFMTKADTSIKNCYYNGKLVDYNEDFATNGINFLRSTNGSMINCYGHFDLVKQINHAYDVSVFDDLGFNDWYIPSWDEMYQIALTGVFWSQKYKGATNSGHLTSSEKDADNFYGFNYTYTKYPYGKKTEYYSLMLARTGSYNINDEPRVGQPYLGGTCFYKNASTLSYRMCGASWVAEGARLFNWGSTGSFLNTSTGFDSGPSNTALMAAAINSSQGATNWKNYVYPTLPSYSLYPMAPYPTASHTNNYSAVVSKDSNITISNYPGGENVTDASLRDPSTFINWDFTNVWQASTGRLPTLKNNIETPFVGLELPTKTTTQIFKLKIKNFTDLLSDGSVGLKVETFDGSLLYDASGLTHNVTLANASDYHLVLKPYYLTGVTKTIPYFRDYYFYPYNQTAITYPSIIQNITLNSTTVGADIKNVHGSLFYNGYIYGSARFNGAIIKINASDYSDHSYVIPSGTWSLDQIVYCNRYIWGTNGQKLIRFDPSTLAYKWATITNITVNGSEPIVCSHDRYLYLIGTQYTLKIDSNYLLGMDLSTNCPSYNVANAIVGTYDSYIRGQYLIYKNSWPSYLGNSKGAVHSAISDGDNLYLAYTTQNGTFFDGSGFNASTGLSGHEIHKISIADMSTGSYAVIPKCTDDMDQDSEYTYLGCEVQPLANASTYGFGCSAVSVRKSDLKVSLLSRDEPAGFNPPIFQSFGVFKKGAYLIDLRTTGNIALLNTVDASIWSLATPTMKYRNDYLSPNTGVANDMVVDYNGIYHFFTWGVAGGSPQPSGLYKIRIPSKNVVTGIPIIKTLDASFSH